MWSVKSQQKKNKCKWGSLIHYFFVILLLIFCVTCAASVGSADVGPFDSLKIIGSKIPFVGKYIKPDGIKNIYYTIIWEVRLPRIMLSALTGSSLALVGAVFQGLFRNPLADPHIIGVSSGAALGATAAILGGFHISFWGLGAIGCFAFIGALITVAFVYQIACSGSRVQTVNLLLTGTAISTMLSAVISLLMTLNRDGLERVYLWTLGSFSVAGWTKVGYLFLFLLTAGSFLYLYSGELNLLSTGEETAESLGVDSLKVKRRLVVAASLLVAACVSVSGIIGFIGLIIPHCMRFLVGPDYRKLLPFSLLGGALFMILCDTIARTVAAPSELPVGVITSIIGAPYFIFLLWKNKHGGLS